MSNIISSFFNNLLERIQKTLKDKVEEILQRLIRVIAAALIGITLVLLGLFYVSTGIIKYLAAVLGSEAAANGLAGIFLVLLGTIILLISMRRK